jgi:hypothetical protein
MLRLAPREEIRVLLLGYEHAGEPGDSDPEVDDVLPEAGIDADVNAGEQAGKRRPGAGFAETRDDVSQNDHAAPYLLRTKKAR